MDQYLLDNHIDARRYNSRETTYRYCKIIKQSWQFKFLESAQISYETDKIFFCHAPQSIVKPDPTFHQLIWGNSADFDIDTDRKFKVPNNKTISVHGHYHRLSEGVNFPRIHNYRHGGLFRQVVLADCGCGCFGGTTEGKLHPVILSEDDNSTRIEVIL